MFFFKILKYQNLIYEIIDYTSNHLPFFGFMQ